MLTSFYPEQLCNSDIPVPADWFTLALLGPVNSPSDEDADIMVSKTTLVIVTYQYQQTGLL